MTIKTVDATLTQQQVNDVVATIISIRDKLDFLIGLSPQERREVAKMGRKAQTFAVRALDMAVQHNQVMPRNLNIEEARRDLALFESLNPILQAVSQLYELLSDTQMVAGGEAYAAARLAYNTAKASGKNLGIDDVLEDLSQQFRRSRKTQPPTN
jgi:restriction endonuclease Mrr